MDNMQIVCNLLEYIGLDESDLEDVYSKISWWTFVISLAHALEEYGSLTIKQEEALVSMVLKHTGAICHPELLSHTAMYKRKGKRQPKPQGSRVDHPFTNLSAIQLYDLPFESGSTHTLEFHPYNSHSTVVQITGRYYKIPLPVQWPKPTEPTELTFTYTRTAMKGYMKITH